MGAIVIKWKPMSSAMTLLVYSTLILLMLLKESTVYRKMRTYTRMHYQITVFKHSCVYSPNSVLLLSSKVN